METFYEQIKTMFNNNKDDELKCPHIKSDIPEENDETLCPYLMLKKQNETYEDDDIYIKYFKYIDDN